MKCSPKARHLSRESVETRHGLKWGISWMVVKHSSRDRLDAISHHFPVCRMYDRLKVSRSVYSNRANFNSKDGVIARGSWTVVCSTKVEIAPIPLHGDVHKVVELRIFWRRFYVLRFQHRIDQFSTLYFHLSLNHVRNFGLCS